ncbi:MAG: aminopeptidase [Lachnospiraceae bacterium]|nr:aminopeptidase [Lachnospiraceae bacterium]
MNFEIVMAMLAIVAVLTGLVTQAVKSLLDEYNKSYHPNMLAGCVALVLSLAVGIGYAILIGAAINAQYAVWLIALVFLSWLSAMVGYDKVIQTLTQIRGN